jgi:hypothetical protein
VKLGVKVQVVDKRDIFNGVSRQFTPGLTYLWHRMQGWRNRHRLSSALSWSLHLSWSSFRLID